jgi:hypothetical protein
LGTIKVNPNDGMGIPMPAQGQWVEHLSKRQLNETKRESNEKEPEYARNVGTV